MPTRKELSLEEMSKIPVRKLPFSKDVKTELLGKSVYTLDQIHKKFLKLIDFNTDSIKVYLPGFKREVYTECLYLLSSLELIPGKHKPYRTSYRYKKIVKYASEKI